MAIVLYIRKDYFRGVTLSDKSAHILEFHYKGENVDVFEKGVQVFHLQYFLRVNSKQIYWTSMFRISPFADRDTERCACLRYWIS